jgi:alanyl-tRNA synthetase
MNTNDIRSAFIEFYGDRDHTVVPSASLIPIDPSLLLTVAGMVPFKPYLLGEETPPYLRAVSSQKCLRTVDLEILGSTARHLSFFEMLGNFSFGDYFMEKAIPLAYELLTETYGIDPELLWFTVHDDDDEAAEIWLDGVGVRPDRLQRRGNDENFWEMGVAGPAGMSSEIFFDRGPERGPDGGPIVDEERFVEIYNLVFMQFIQDKPFNVVGSNVWRWFSRTSTPCSTRTRSARSWPSERTARPRPTVLMAVPTYRCGSSGTMRVASRS